MSDFCYYNVLDTNLEKAKTDSSLKKLLRENFCHNSYRNRLQYDDEKFKFYCNFFDLDYDYMIKNIHCQN